MNKNTYNQKDEKKNQTKPPQKASLPLVSPARFYFKISDARFFLITHQPSENSLSEGSQMSIIRRSKFSNS